MAKKQNTEIEKLIDVSQLIATVKMNNYRLLKSLSTTR